MTASGARSAEEVARLRAEVEAPRCERDEARRDRDREREEGAAPREIARTAGLTPDVDAVLEAIVDQASVVGECGAGIYVFAAILRGPGGRRPAKFPPATRDRRSQP